MDSFKVNLRAYLFSRNVPLHFCVGARVSSIFHTRLRLGHSTLACHLFSHGLSDDQRCECGFEKEDVCHYFLQCDRFAAHRVDLLSCFSQVLQLDLPVLLQMKNFLLGIILNGSSDLSFEENTALFLAVQHYITKSRRFSLN